MEFDAGDGGSAHPHIDADAVCERCGSVNPEDTLLCKTCGNNLRDQRTRRIAEGGVPELEAAAEGGGWLKRSVAAVGILLVLWAALNIDVIAEWMVEFGQPPVAAAFWRSPEDQNYADLVDQLGARQARQADVEAALAAVPAEAPFSGLFVLVSEGSSPQPLGLAAARRSGDVVYFVARLNAGGEVRGFGRLDSRDSLRATDSAGVFVNGRYRNAAGFAQRQGGALLCVGLLDAEPETYSIRALPLPR